MGRLAFSIALFLMLASVPSADGATIRLSHRVANTGDAPVLHYEAGPGEANRLRVLTEPHVLHLIDEGATIDSEGTACTADGPHEVSCPRRPLGRVTLGDMDDTFSGDDRVLIREGYAAGGSGADVIEGSSSVENLSGGPGPDRLMARGGNDFFGDGNEDGSDSDVYEGGSGRDTISYSSDLPLTVDLNRETPNGRPDENDTLLSIEDARATGRAVRLIGTPRGDDLAVRTSDPSGVAVVNAGAGADTIEATGFFREEVMAGPGEDYIELANAWGNELADGVSCGTGGDVVIDPNVSTVLPEDCEHVFDGYRAWRFQLHLPLWSSRATLVEAGSDQGCQWGDPCPRLALTLRRADASNDPVGPVLGRTIRTPLKRFYLRLNRRGRRTLARRGEIVAHVQLAEDDWGGPFAFLARVRVRP